MTSQGDQNPCPSNQNRHWNKGSGWW